VIKKTIKLAKQFLKRIYHNIVFLPVLLTISFIVVAFVMLYIENKGVYAKIGDKANLFFLNDLDTARALLGVLISGLISLTVFSFSMVMLTLNIASSNYSPRLLPDLINNKTNQTILGMFIGVLSYCIIVLLNTTPAGEYSVMPAMSTSLGVLLALICLFLFVFFIQSVSSSLQIENIVNEVHKKGINRLSKLNEKFNQEKFEYSKWPKSDNWNVFESKSTGYLNDINVKELSSLIEQYNCKIAMLHTIGDHVVEGMSLVKCDKSIDDEMEDKMDLAIGIGNYETIDNQYIHGFKHITEVVVRALSPGVNDPGTALSGIDKLTTLFVELLKLDMYNSIKLNGETAIWLKRHSFERLLGNTMASIRQYAKNDVIVTIKLMQSLIDILSMKNHVNETNRQAIVDELNYLREDADYYIKNTGDRLKINNCLNKLDNRKVKLLDND